MTKQYTKQEVLDKIKEIADIMEEYDIEIDTNWATNEVEVYSKWVGTLEIGMTNVDGEDLKEALEEYTP